MNKTSAVSFEVNFCSVSAQHVDTYNDFCMVNTNSITLTIEEKSPVDLIMLLPIVMGHEDSQSKTYIPKNASNPSPQSYSIPHLSANFFTKIQ